MFRQLGRAFGVAILAAVFAGIGSFSSAQAFSNGGSLVSFGNISVSYQGLSARNGQKTLPWNELKTVKVRSGVINIKKAGAFLDWEIIRMADMLNVCVFVALTERVAGSRKMDAR